MSTYDQAAQPLATKIIFVNFVFKSLISYFCLNFKPVRFACPLCLSGQKFTRDFRNAKLAKQNTKKQKQLFIHIHTYKNK